MTAEFRFFGSETILRGETLSQYGQKIEMESAEADALIAAHPPALILPAGQWDEIFPPGTDTDKLLAEYPSANMHGAAPAEFLDRTRAVRVAFHVYREGLLHPPEAQKGGFPPPVETHANAPISNGAVEAEAKG